MVSDARVPGRAERLVRTLALAPRLPLDGYDKVVIMALRAPHMVILARTLNRRGAVPVHLDLCDSRRLLAADRSRPSGRLGRLRTAAAELLATAAFTALPESLERSYISRKDADADRDLSSSPVHVIGPRPDPALARIEPLVGRPMSVLCPVDITTDEGRHALSALMSAVAGLEDGVPVEVTGDPPVDALPGADDVVWLGRVPSLVELYDRRCVVVSTNPGGHGVQNKLWEAFQARRPIVAFDQALHWAPERNWIRRVPQGGDFGAALLDALGRRYDTGGR